MIRVLLFFAILFALAVGFAWLSDVPGMISISWNGYVWEQPPAVVAVVAGVLLAIFLAVVWVIRVILKSPHIASRFFQRRRKDKGYQALSQGLIALGTGNSKQARRHAVDADRLLSDEPAAKLLLAQTAQLAGKDDEARGRFEAMLEDPRTKALGLHGLFVEAERHREPVAARHYAEEAAKTSPGLEWAGKAVLGYQAVAHHWDEALKTLERNYAAKMMDKKTYRRQRAVILTALAQKLEDGEPERAYSLAKEAHGMALDLVPAAVLTSRLATRRGDIRKASKVLETTWRLFPHPELAETYAHVRTGDSAVDRLKRVKSLSAQRANTGEGALAVAQAALEAREFDEARAQLKKVLQSEPSRKAFLLMAEVEEAEHGDRGRMRDWLARAIKAPLDKVWMADGVVSADWQAVSPVTGKLDAFNWVTPGGLSDEESVLLEDSVFEAPALPAAAVAAASSSLGSSEAKADKPGDDLETVDLTPEPVSPKPVAPKPASKEPEAQTKTEASPETVEPDKESVKGHEGTTDDVGLTPPLNDLPETPKAAEKTAEPEKSAPVKPSEPIKADNAPKLDGPPKEASATEKPAVTSSAGEPGKSKPVDKNPIPGKEELNGPIEFALTRMPDDPGPDDDEDTADKKPRPRFFN
ncbi:heme biosynthesis HemY N-terminal domain-containing protein [Labrenzia sp. OB1]|uniref:heme biosynthesis HemY N-terminal domain-containing protein n=1 Tax=Labrenzia sp. OB1 TaxID=1561204 RepID=UPI0007B25631|nr:heme biosynthesis HemY N-terminal domain-containing protein [Labrenzia sp. OB1]KZM50459.1 heme biosynthesis protein HemY [Labrenzia sp. OB1]